MGARIREVVVVGGGGGGRTRILSLLINVFLLISFAVQCYEGATSHILLKNCNFGKHGTTSSSSRISIDCKDKLSEKFLPNQQGSLP